jgi:hypothetical protein
MASITDEAMMEQWDNMQLLKEFEERVELHKTLVGNLYPNILLEVIETLGQECIKRTGHHPNHWREQGIVPASWTDEHGITHEWNSSHRIRNCRADDPVRSITCLHCVVK